MGFEDNRGGSKEHRHLPLLRTACRSIYGNFWWGLGIGCSRPSEIWNCAPRTPPHSLPASGPSLAKPTWRGENCKAREPGPRTRPTHRVTEPDDCLTWQAFPDSGKSPWCPITNAVSLFRPSGQFPRSRECTVDPLQPGSGRNSVVRYAYSRLDSASGAACHRGIGNRRFETLPDCCESERNDGTCRRQHSESVTCATEQRGPPHSVHQDGFKSFLPPQRRFPDPDRTLTLQPERTNTTRPHGEDARHRLRLQGEIPVPERLRFLSGVRDSTRNPPLPTPGT